ncbi:MAG: chemotaxis response regulator protein-glutamate methylesterase [bacterium]
MLDKKLKVLVVDDSTIIRRILSDILNSHPDIEVVGIAINGKMALTQVEALKPDVITLDVEMPFMNGLETLKELNKIKPTPTVMISSLTKRGAEVTIKALELGAVDFITKPDNPEDFKHLKNDIINKVKSASMAKKPIMGSVSTPKALVNIPAKRTISSINNLKTVVIGSSTGGPQALKEVIPFLPKDLPARFLVVQHMPPKFTEMFAQRLDKISELTVKEAKDGDMLEVGKVLLAPGNYHMNVEPNGKISLNQEPSVWGVRPAVDITLGSAAKVYKQDLICVILTGMGKDGSKGSEAVKKLGGFCIAEDQSTCIIYGMPKCVIDAGHADRIEPIHNVANAIVEAIYR